MTKALIRTGVLGLIILTAHFCINEFLLNESQKNTKIYWLDPLLFVISLLMIYICYSVHKRDSTKTALVFSGIGMIKLITLGIIVIVLSKEVAENEKISLAFHILIPAILFLAIEAIEIIKLLRKKV